MIKSYLLKRGSELKEHGEISGFKKLFSKLLEANIKNAVIFMNENALYFESNDFAGLVEVERSNIGAAKILLRRLGRDKLSLSSLEEVFEFAEKLDKMDLDEVAKFLR